VTANQSIHEQYGGVIPELASRDHQKNILPVIDLALKKAQITLNDLNAIAVTLGPGLSGSLLVGLSFAKSLSLALNIPLIEVNHMQGHILAHFIKEGTEGVEETEETKGIEGTEGTEETEEIEGIKGTEGIVEKRETEIHTSPEFPFLCLTVSGGHTQIIKVTSHLQFELLAETEDDAVGEAFDKAAKILGLPYPGGPLIDKYASSGNPKAYTFPTPQLKNNNYSFSGVKTSFLYFIQAQTKLNPHFISEYMHDICASYQSHLIKYLLKNLIQVSQETSIKHIAIAGGVSANSELRKQLDVTGKKYKWNTYIPKFEYCTDNAAMIAITGFYKFLENQFCELDVTPKPRYHI
jgi:N6-L-threonylcarbamoyladenine synthase